MDKWELAYDDYKKGLKYREIATKHGVSESTVKSWKSRHWSKMDSQADEVKRLRRVATKCNTKKTKRNPKKVATADKLNDKQKQFCLLYLQYLNGTKAYQEVYDCSYSTANSESVKLLRKTSIKDYLKELKAALRQESFVDIQDIIANYAKMATADITDFLEFGMEEVPTKKGDTIKVPYIHFKPSDEVDGTLIQEVKIGRDGVSIKLYDKQRAMQELLKILGGDELRQAQIAKLKALNNLDAPTAVEDDGFIDALNQKGAELWQNEE